MNTNPTLIKLNIPITDAIRNAALQARADFYAELIYNAWRELRQAWQWLANRPHAAYPGFRKFFSSKVRP